MSGVCPSFFVPFCVCPFPRALGVTLTSTPRSFLLFSSLPSSSSFFAQQHQQHHRYRPRRLVPDASGTRASHLSALATLALRTDRHLHGIGQPSYDPAPCPGIVVCVPLTFYLRLGLGFSWPDEQGLKYKSPCLFCPSVALSRSFKCA